MKPQPTSQSPELESDSRARSPKSVSPAHDPQEPLEPLESFEDPLLGEFGASGVLDGVDVDELTGVYQFVSDDEDYDKGKPIVDEEMLRREVGLYHMIRKQSKKLKKAKRRMRKYSEMLHKKDERIAELEAALEDRRTGTVWQPMDRADGQYPPTDFLPHGQGPSPFRPPQAANVANLQVASPHGGETNNWKVALNNDEIDRLQQPNLNAISQTLRDSARKHIREAQLLRRPVWSPWPQPPTSITELVQPY